MLNNMEKKIKSLKNVLLNEENKVLDVNHYEKNDSEKITLEYINNRINKEVCNHTINILKDTYLINEYKKCKSVQNRIKRFELILDKYNIEKIKKELILNDYIVELIPAGTKGVIKGNKFNSLVKDNIKNLKLKNQRFEICFEKQCEVCITSEKPDWYILEKSTGKVIIGMNQLDLVGGGHQINRGYKYLIDNKHNTVKSKLVCVICNYIQFRTNNNKAYKLFEVGYLNNTLCYLKNLELIIDIYFN